MVPEVLSKKYLLFYCRNDMIKRLFSISIPHICFVSLNISFNLPLIDILKTRNDVYICAHSEWISYVYSKGIECSRFPNQSIRRNLQIVNIT